MLGGSASTGLHGYYYLESPVINTSAAAGSVYLNLWRWLTSDYTPYMQNVIEVYNGSAWVAVFTTGGYPGVKDAAWTPLSYNVTAYKSAAFKFRVGFNVGSSGVYSDCGQWTLDDVSVSSAACP